MRAGLRRWSGDHSDRPYRHFRRCHRPYRRCYPRNGYYRSDSRFGLYRSFYYPRAWRYGVGYDYLDYPTYYDTYDLPTYYDGYTTVYPAAPTSQRYYDDDVYYADTITIVTPDAVEAAPLETGVVVTPPIAGYDSTTSGEAAVTEPAGVEPAYPGTEAESRESGEAPLGEAEVGSWINDGNAAFLEGRYEDARRQYVRVVFADERDGFAKLLYGLASFALGDHELAAVAVRRALDLLPELIDDPIDLRGFYPDQVTLEAQISALLAILREHPDDPEGLFLLGYLYYAIGQPDEAVATLQQLVDFDPIDELAPRVRDAAKRYAGAPVATPGPE